MENTENKVFEEYVKAQRKINPFAPYELQIGIDERKKLIANSLRDFRNMNGYSQKQIAELLGITPQTYNGYEKARNEPPVEVLVRLSFLYDISVDFLVCRDVFFIEENGALKQLEEYNRQIELMKQEFSSSAMAENEQMKAFVDGLEQLTKALTDQVKSGTMNKKKDD